MTMEKFFKYLKSSASLNDFAEALDWLFDDQKFSEERNWNRGYVSKYTKKIKAQKHLSNAENRVYYGKCIAKDFEKNDDRLPYITMKSGDSFARDLIRHIRNGIAHGNTNIIIRNGIPHVEINDYSDKPKSQNKQTAKMFLPISYITEFYKLYEEINKSIRHTSQKDRKATKKYAKE